MAVYAGKTKLPQGDIFDMLEGGRYFGPSRGVGIGLGTGLGLGALFSKKKEDESNVVKLSDHKKKDRTPPDDENGGPEDPLKNIPEWVQKSIDTVREKWGDRRADDLEKRVIKKLENLGEWRDFTEGVDEAGQYTGPSPKYDEDTVYDVLDELVSDFIHNLQRGTEFFDPLNKYKGGIVSVNHLTRRL